MTDISLNSNPPRDKFKATWVSFSSTRDFLQCPRSYYLNNVYKDPRSQHKISLMNPSLALGQAVHEVIESLSTLPTKERFKQPLTEKLAISWKKVSGKKGGFADADQEQAFKRRAVAMLDKVTQNPGPLMNLAVKITQDLPHYWFSEEQEIILCGKIDWLEYMPDRDTVHVIDFKTSQKREANDSLQLPVYLLLATHCQKRAVAKASYWYLELDNEPIEVNLPTEASAYTRVFEVAKEVKLARKLERFTCPQGSQGCFYCRPLEKIVRGEAEFVGVNDFKQDIYIFPQESVSDTSIVL